MAHAKRIQDFDTEKLLPNEAYKADGDAILSADEHQSNVLEDKKVKTHGGSDLNLKKPTGKDEEQKLFLHPIRYYAISTDSNDRFS